MFVRQRKRRVRAVQKTLFQEHPRDQDIVLPTESLLAVTELLARLLRSYRLAPRGGDKEGIDG